MLILKRRCSHSEGYHYCRSAWSSLSSLSRHILLRTHKKPDAEHLARRGVSFAVHLYCCSFPWFSAARFLLAHAYFSPHRCSRTTQTMPGSPRQRLTRRNMDTRTSRSIRRCRFEERPTAVATVASPETAHVLKSPPGSGNLHFQDARIVFFLCTTFSLLGDHGCAHRSCSPPCPLALLLLRFVL